MSGLGNREHEWAELPSHRLIHGSQADARPRAGACHVHERLGRGSTGTGRTALALADGRRAEGAGTRERVPNATAATTICRPRRPPRSCTLQGPAAPLAEATLEEAGLSCAQVGRATLDRVTRVTPPQLAIHTDSAVSCGTRLWRFRGQLQLTVVVKAVFAIVPNGVATLAGPGEIVSHDRHYDAHPLRSVEAASDLPPYLARCDVLFVGHAHASGVPTPTAAVRLGLSRDGHALLDKTIHVYGDRGSTGVPQPFACMPIVYERAVGRPGAPNPVGTETPNLADPSDRSKAACFGPISSQWPVRTRFIGPLDGTRLDGLVAELPEAIAWDYFQAAPPNQQTELLRGGEWLVLDGLHPTRPRVQTRLPAAHGAARVVARRRSQVDPHVPPAAVELACDTLAIDGDQQTLALSWRGQYAVLDGEAALPSLTVLAALELPGIPTDWARILGTAPLGTLGPVPHGKVSRTMALPAMQDVPGIPADWGRVLSTAALDTPGPIPHGKVSRTKDLPATQQAVLASLPAIPFHSSEHEPVPSTTLQSKASPPARAATEIAGAPWSWVPAPPVPRVGEEDAVTAEMEPLKPHELFAPALVPEPAPDSMAHAPYPLAPPVRPALRTEPPPSVIAPLPPPPDPWARRPEPPDEPDPPMRTPSPPTLQRPAADDVKDKIYSGCWRSGRSAEIW